MLSFWVIHKFFYCVVIGTSKPHVIQGSTVIQSQNEIKLQKFETQELTIPSPTPMNESQKKKFLLRIHYDYRILPAPHSQVFLYTKDPYLT